MQQYVNDNIKISRDLRINDSLYFGDKNSMQAFIGDIDMISSEYRG